MGDVKTFKTQENVNYKILINLVPYNNNNNNNNNNNKSWWILNSRIAG
jgi:hypothetical protein